MANRNRDGKREAFWRGVLKRHARSGHSVRAFCRREQLSEPSFYAWRRTIQERDTTGQHSPRPAFLPAAISPTIRDAAPPDSGLVIELRGGRRLRLPASMAAARVAELVQALETGVEP
jgi:transposase-like protein